MIRTQKERLREKTVERQFLYEMEKDFELAPATSRAVLEAAKQVLLASVSNGSVGEGQMQQLFYPKVLIIDEIGYLPMNREEASLFFGLLTRRYERASLILTSNKSFIDWGEIFNDQVLATAILDRLLHHFTTINIKGESYRLKEKRKAGLLGANTKDKEVSEKAH